MTTPGGNAPDGAYVIGTRFGSDETEAGIRARLKGQAIGGFADAQGLFGALFAGITQWLTNLNAVVDEQVTQAGEITDTLTDHENRIDLLEGGSVVVRTYAFNSVWEKPLGLQRLGIAVEGGGDAGRTASTIAANIGGTGGSSGGYRFVWFDKEELDAIGDTESITIGAGGNTPSQLGGVSRFGDHVSSVAGIGAVLSIEGSTLSNSAAGDGGNGGNGSNANFGITVSGGAKGGSSAFAAGGAGGSTAGTRAGGDGVDAVLSPKSRGNGGSGGGGGGSSVAGSSGGAGGNGGFPAGAGGGGGARNVGLGSSDGPGGLGADGRVTVIEYMTPEE